MRLEATRLHAISHSGFGDFLYDSAGEFPGLDLSFAANKNLTDSITGLNLISFTRASTGTYVGADGLIKSATTNEARFDHNPTTGESLGLLVEEPRTNSIRNNTGVGAVAGTPGTLPTNWSQSNNTGLAANVVGTGTENGITYIDLRVNGTTTGTGQTNILFETSIGVAATTGQTWSLSSYLKIQAGSLTNVGVINLVLQENTAVGTAVTAGAQAITIPMSSLGTYRPTFTRTLSGGVTVAAVMPYIQININTGLVVDFTLRIGLPQVEQGAFATSVILTDNTSAGGKTRAADVAQITGTNFSSWYNQTEGTVFAETQLQSIAARNAAIVDINDATSNNRNIIRAFTTGSGDQLTIRSGNTTVATLSSSSGPGLITRRTAGAYRVDDFSFTAQGLAPAIDTSGAVPASLTQMLIGSALSISEPLGGTIKRLTYWPVRLGNNVLQVITQ